MAVVEEWSRSRYWLCHFLQSRHERTKISFDQPMPISPAIREPLIAWMSRCAAGQGSLGPALIARAVDRCDNDPAYIQSLRLFIKEQQYHASLIAGCLRAMGIAEPVRTQPGVFLRGGGVLGFRYDLSALLLVDLVDLGVLSLLRDHADHPTLRAATEGMIREKSAHVSFHAERLTQAFADFYFVRRNLRRARLRAMFAMKLARMLAQHSPLLIALGVERRRFLADSWQRFEVVLEAMVPYRREQLLRALFDQRHKPYAQATDLL